MNQRDCKKCVYYGGKRKGKVFCLNDKCVRENDRTAGKETDMEVKINREIRNYTESMFLDCRSDSSFFCSRLWRCSRTVFLAQTVCWHGNRIVGVHFGCCPVCGTWLCEVQRYDRRESNLCVDKVGVFDAEEAGISLHQCLLRTDEAKH